MLFDHDHSVVRAPQEATEDLSPFGYRGNSASNCKRPVARSFMFTAHYNFRQGANLIGDSGTLNWGGGSNDCHLRPETGFFRLCPNIAAPKAALWGSPQFMGLGFLSFITIVLVCRRSDRLRRLANRIPFRHRSSFSAAPSCVTPP